MRRLRQFCKQQTIQAVTRGVDAAKVDRITNAATGFVQMCAVVELAMRHVGFEVWHVSGQLHGINVVQSKLLESRRINQARVSIPVHPVPGGCGGGVFARIERV